LESELRQRFPVTIDDQALAQVKIPEPASSGSAAPAVSAR
jgi:hypothetical protein